MLSEFSVIVDDEDHSVELLFGRNTSMLDWLTDVKSSLSVWVTDAVDNYCQVGLYGASGIGLMA